MDDPKRYAEPRHVVYHDAGQVSAAGWFWVVVLCAVALVVYPLVLILRGE